MRGFSDASVAQLVEQCPFKALVPSSSLGGSTRRVKGGRDLVRKIMLVLGFLAVILMIAFMRP